MPEKTSQEFIRRKFTITEGLDTDLEELANDHYQGNVSLCIRQAINDHKGTLSGESRVTLKRLNHHIREIEERINAVTKTVGAVADSVDELSGQNPSTTPITPSAESEWEETAQVVFTVLETADSALRFEDIVERGALKPMAARKGLARLKDSGYVFQSKDNPPRYYVAKMTHDSTKMGENGHGN